MEGKSFVRNGTLHVIELITQQGFRLGYVVVEERGQGAGEKLVGPAILRHQGVLQQCQHRKKQLSLRRP